MSVTRCQHCQAAVEWLTTIGTKRLPFDHGLVELDELGDRVGWIPGTRKGRVVMMPLDHVGHEKRAAARRAATVHRCPQYVRTKERPEP